MNYPNLPNSDLEISEQPQAKEIPNDTIISKVSNGSDFSTASFTQELNDTTTRSN
ncbi:hypothetical protein [Helicobacter pylori]|uniref:hypothetical protein n=1 Tax=Helicobacter pylori TaxID=210 RepID=UPI000385E715|nr:hypothetical protein [Helicobacter pylori]EPZ73363.1 hypothetical protein N206_08295 [Helicobacter pylori UM111]